MKSKIITLEQAVAHVKDGATIMVGGFLGNGDPKKIIDLLVEKNVKNLTIICNDTAFPEVGIGKLIVNRQVKKVITSHIGTNPVTGELMHAGEVTVEFVPQGTLAEQIRCAGNGLGGVLTKTGLGTIVEEKMQKINVDGEDYLLATPLKAEVALIAATYGDKLGNLKYRGTSQNFNPLMAMAADIVIAEIENMLEVDEIEPECVHTPAIFVDYIVH
ncbi:MAG: CoA transferase subunit A [Bacteroidales bacterium]|nr:CoA transferase subunit A [Bacteroidales bacterium]